jgi:hypothetical protein
MISKYLIFAVLVVVIAVLAYYLLFVLPAPATSQPDINSSFVSVYYKTCVQCSQGITDTVYSILSNNGYLYPQQSVFFNTTQGNSVISRYLVTFLPSAVIPATNSSSNLLSALVYLNIFNVNSNHFVLNTPFMAGLTRNVTYSNLLDNGSVSTAYDIYNASALYNVSSSAIRNYTNPSEFLLIYNSSSLVFNNKIGIIFVYSNSTFSAVQDLLLKSALDSFGNFSGLSLTNSSSVAVTPTETVGRIEYYNLLKMPYSSGFFSLQTYNLSNVVSSQEAEKVLFEYDQNAGQAAFSQLGNFMPFLDIGGRYIEVSSMLNPVLFSGLSVSQLQQKINSDPTMRDMFDQSVAFLDAVLCSYTNNSEPICRSSSVTSAATAIRNQI